MLPPVLLALVYQFEGLYVSIYGRLDTVQCIGLRWFTRWLGYGFTKNQVQTKLSSEIAPIRGHAPWNWQIKIFQNFQNLIIFNIYFRVRCILFLVLVFFYLIPTYWCFPLLMLRISAANYSRLCFLMGTLELLTQFYKIYSNLCFFIFLLHV